MKYDAKIRVQWRLKIRNADEKLTKLSSLVNISEGKLSLNIASTENNEKYKSGIKSKDESKPIEKEGCMTR